MQDAEIRQVNSKWNILNILIFKLPNIFSSQEAIRNVGVRKYLKRKEKLDYLGAALIVSQLLNTFENFNCWSGNHIDLNFKLLLNNCNTRSVLPGQD